MDRVLYKKKCNVCKRYFPVYDGRDQWCPHCKEGKAPVIAPEDCPKFKANNKHCFMCNNINVDWDV